MPESLSPVEALRHSHDRLAGLVADLDETGVTRMSYCSEWTIAQVLSHLGSSAEIGRTWLDSALTHSEPMGQDGNREIWARWDARSPMEQVTEAIATDRRLVEAFEELGDEDLAAAHIALFGGTVELDGSGLALFRLPEHSVHTWDVAVALDPSARVAPYAVKMIIDDVPNRIGWAAKPQGGTWSITVETTAPDRVYTLSSSGDSVTMRAGVGDGADGVLKLPAEALLRLVYGRLDAWNLDDTDLSGTKLTLDDLRDVFPGF
jgi:uncharacterized protein (TIGR03083 family)